MKADYHLHCEFSDDSVEPMENQIQRAILELAIKNDKGIEINTSSWHYGLSDTQPC